MAATRANVEQTSRRARRWASHWAQYIGLRSVSGLLHAFDIDQNLETAGAFGTLFWRVGRSRRRRAEENLRLSFPDWSDERIERTVHRSIRHMFQVFIVDSLAMPRLITPQSWPKVVEIGRIREALDLLLRGRPAILLTGHCGNWEVLGFVLATIGFPMTALARPLDNPHLDEWLLSVREARGMRILTKWGAVPELQRLLETGGRVGFIADQNAGDDGLFVPFFGRLASCYKSIGLLAIRYRVPIVAGCAIRLDDRFRFRLEVTDIIEPEEWESQPDPLFYVTARYARAIEAMIRLAPDQYLWIHRRWKSRPRHERLGRPFPASLRRRLEELPWMTDAELARIIGYGSSPGDRISVAGNGPETGVAPLVGATPSAAGPPTADDEREESAT